LHTFQICKGVSQRQRLIDQSEPWVSQCVWPRTPELVSWSWPRAARRRSPPPAPPPPAFLVLGQRSGSSPVESHHTAVYRRAPARRARTAPRACSTRPGSKNHTERENGTRRRPHTHHTTPHRTAPHRTAPHTAPRRIRQHAPAGPTTPHRTAPHRTAPNQTKPNRNDRTAPHCTAPHEHRTSTPVHTRTTQPPHAHTRRRAGGWVGVPRASRGCSTRPHAT
jgi:hypothetical protein